MTGREAYEQDCFHRPLYHDGKLRKTWDELDDTCRETWARNPTPRTYECRQAEEAS